MQEDRIVKFDIPFQEMRLRAGEKIVDRLENIEDTKGNGGDRGRFVITTLRILWHSTKSPRVNLTIGYNCVLNISSKIVNSKIRGTTQALHLLTLSNNSRYEFIFTNLVPGNTRHFTSVMAVHKAYVSSKLYREQKLRGSIISNKQLKILPLEQVFTALSGVWNLSSDHGSLGTFIVTNVRVVWFADANDAFNISLPHMQIDSIKIRDSKYGNTLVISTSSLDSNHRSPSGGYILGFRVDPESRLQTLFKELTSVYQVYAETPIYGVEYMWRKGVQDANRETAAHNANEGSLLDEGYNDVVDEQRGELGNTLAVYLADEGHKVDRLPVYEPDLGLAVEAIKEGYNMKKLWEVINT